MYGSAGAGDDSEPTAFRRAEKKYKLYYDSDAKSSKKYESQLLHLLFVLVLFLLLLYYLLLLLLLLSLLLFLHSCCSLKALTCWSYLSLLRKRQPRPVDLSDVFDFRCILHSFNQKNELPPGIVALQSDIGRTVFCLENHPGIISNYTF